jgi:hypothetical protein
MKNLMMLGYERLIQQELQAVERVEQLTNFIVNRKIKYDRLLHGITPDGVQQLYNSVKKRVEQAIERRDC